MSSMSEQPEGARTVGRWQELVTFALWALFLVPFLAFEVLSLLGGDPLISSASLLYGGCMLAGVVAVEWPWRSPGQRVAASFLRLILVAVAALWIHADLAPGIPTLKAMNTQNPIRGGFGEAGAYASGVLTMEQEVAILHREARIPFVALVLLCALPGVRAVSGARRRSTDDAPTAS